MKRCLELALQGAGNVAPNPMVGCVIVHGGKIIGEGFHEKYGRSHAEVNAIKSVQDQSLLKQSTLYVNLEPCAHFGKTPPCTDLIIEKEIPEIVIGSIDPHALVAGKGIEKLRAAGRRVLVSVSNEACRKLNKRFFTFHEKKRPFIILKWAQSSDGFMAPASRERIDISNEYSRTLMHRWRSEESAVMVGKNTALSDNPRLDSRLWGEKKPIRIVMDRNLDLSPTLHLLDHTSPTLVVTEKEKSNEENIEFLQLDFSDKFLHHLVAIFHERGIQSVMVEGGGMLHESFIQQRLWDEARVFIAPRFLSEGVAAPKISGNKVSEENICGDRLLIFEN